MSDARRWAVVTGASSGIGESTALRLCDDGWNVAIHYANNESGARRVAQRIADQGAKAAVFQADLQDVEAGPKLVDEVWKQIGPVDAWVQLAGADLLTGPQAKLDFLDKLKLATAVDLWGTVMTCREIGDRMKDRGQGVVIAIGWDQAATGMEGDSGELFAAIKGGVAAFARSLSKSLAPQVRVHCVAPGWIKTAWGESAPQHWQDRVLQETPILRWGLPDDVAATIAFLVSDRAAFLTGQTINVNGGAVTS